MPQVEWRQWEELSTHRVWFQVVVKIEDASIGYRHVITHEMLEMMPDAETYIKRLMMDKIDKFISDWIWNTPAPFNYKKAAASEFEGVEDLDGTLWLKSEGGLL